MDTSFLEAIIQDEFRLPAGSSLTSLTAQLADGLGSPDSDLRENSLSILWEWIVLDRYTPAELYALGEQMAANLIVGTGESGTDSVFLRAFSALILQAVIEQDETYAAGNRSGKTPFLNEADLQRWMQCALNSLVAENDLRGFVAEKGWAHSIAHHADLFLCLGRSRFLGSADLERLLDAIAARLTAPADSILSYQEDERLARAVLSILLRDLLDIAVLGRWLEKLVSPADGAQWDNVHANPALVNARYNTRAFLRSLYFQLQIGMKVVRQMPYYDRSPQIKDVLLKHIVQALKRMDNNHFYAQKEEAL